MGRHDWAAPLDHFKNYLKGVHAHGLALLAGNVKCKDKKDLRCRHLGSKNRPFIMIHRKGLRVAVFGVIREDLAKNFILENAKGLEIKDPVSHLRPLFKKAREKLGADIIVLLTDVDSADTAPRNVLSMVRTLGPDAPDLVVANGLYNPGSQRSSFVSHISRSVGASIVGTSRFGEHVGHVVLKLKKAKNGTVRITDLDLQEHAIRKHRSDESDQQTLKKMMRRLCKKVDVPLGAGVIKRSMSRKDFIRYMLRVLVRRGKGELAMLPDTLFADANFPIKGRITREDIHRAIRFVDPVGILEEIGRAHV